VLRVELVAGQSSPIFVSHHHSIADHDALELDLLVFVGINECTGIVWDIHPTIGLPRDPKVISLHLRKSLKPELQRSHIIVGSSALIVDISGVIVD
jgi:hypothetical protein